MKNIYLIILFLSLPFNAIIFAQGGVVTGVITSPEKPVKEMTVTSSGSVRKGQPNKSGRFKINATSFEKDTVFIQIATDSLLYIPLDGANQLYISLKKDTILIHKEKKEYVNSVYGGTVVTRSTLEGTGETNLLKAIAMKVAGVEYAHGNLLIRGAQSLTGNIYPLYVIDGVETYDASYLTVRDVESVEVLKGSATSFFGVRGTNGVIIIKTTKF